MLTNATAGPATPVGSIGNSVTITISIILLSIIITTAVSLSGWVFAGYEYKYLLETFIYHIPKFGVFIDERIGLQIYEWSSGFEYHFNSILIFSLILGITLGIRNFIQATPSSEIHEAGRKLLDGRKVVKAAQKELLEEQKYGGEGIAIIQTPTNDFIDISADRETRHFMILGSVGGGKTTVLRNMIDEAYERNDRSIILDNKADFSSTLPGAGLAIIAPWDSRGVGWAIAQDVRSAADAREFSNSVIPSNDKDPIWSNGARAILSACIIRMQLTKKTAWSFCDIVEIFRLGDEEIQATVNKYSPENSTLLADLQSKMSTSFLVSVKTFIRPIFDLSDAFDYCKCKHKISIRKWLNPQPGDFENRIKRIALQGNGQFSAVQEAITKGIFGVIVRQVTSPSFSDASPLDRRIWLFCDEFPQFGKIENFGKLLEVGRSKGVRICLGLQDVNQIKKLYGDEDFKTWSSLVGTYIITRTSGVETPKWLCDLVGKRRVKQYEASYSGAIIGTTDNGSQRTDQWRSEELDVVRPDEFSGLGKDNKGVEVFLFTASDHVYKLRAKHITAEQKKIKRKPHIPAEWTLPGYPYSIDKAIKQGGK